MKRLKQLIEAMRLLSDDQPSARIREAWTEFSASADGADDRDREILARLIEAVASVAEDMEKPAKDEVKS